MTFARSVFLLFFFIGFSTPLWAEDYKADPGFNPVFSANDRVEEVVVLPDGKLVIGGAICGSTGTSSCTLHVEQWGSAGDKPIPAQQQ